MPALDSRFRSVMTDEGRPWPSVVVESPHFYWPLTTSSDSSASPSFHRRHSRELWQADALYKRHHRADRFWTRCQIADFAGDRSSSLLRPREAPRY
jgi:hypothetical protein